MAESYVGKPCPKCRHVRTAAEVAPDWQCPKCGVAYAKFAQAQPAAVGTATISRATSAAPTRVSSGGGSTGLATFVHVSILLGIFIPFFGIIVPVVVWIMKKDSDPIATANAKEAINFQISMLLWALPVIALTIVVGIFGLVLALILGLVALIYPIIAAVKANGGEDYRYPLTLHIFS